MTFTATMFTVMIVLGVIWLALLTAGAVSSMRYVRERYEEELEKIKSGGNR